MKKNRKKKKFKFVKEDIPYYILTALIAPAVGIGLIAGYYFTGSNYTIDENLKYTLLVHICFIIVAILAVPWEYCERKKKYRKKKKEYKEDAGRLIVKLIFFTIFLGINIHPIIEVYESLNSPKKTEYVCVTNYESGNARGGTKGIWVRFDNGKKEKVVLAGPTYSYGWWEKVEIQKNEKVRLTYDKNYYYGSVTKLTGEKC